MPGDKGTSILYRAIKATVRLCYPKMKIIGAENLPDQAAVIVSNHAQMHGPIASELYFPGRRYTWCAGEMMNLKDVPDYAFNDFWHRKPGYIRWFYRLLSYIIAPLSVCVFNNADTIGVYRDARAVSTFRDTVKRLKEGASVVIFPERDQPMNNILYAFEERFADVARMYYRATGRELDFVPMYIAPRLRLMCIGEPVRFRADAPRAEERSRICRCLSERIVDMARELPPHTVIPYRNMPKKQYPLNIDKDVEL